MNKVDAEYFRLLKTILNDGKTKKNRTGVDTTSIFGEMAKFDVRMDAFPILTTKKVYFRAIVYELLWFIKGDTNIKYLVDNDVHIWDEWGATRWMKEAGVKGHISAMLPIYVKQIKEDAAFAEKWGELGKGTYGGVWRDFPTDDIKYDGTHTLGIDQLATVMNKLRDNPDDRRIIVSAWHPYWSEKCALAPCHVLFQFNTEELTTDERYNYANNTLRLSESPEFFTVTTDEQIDQWLNKLGVPTRRLNLLMFQRSLDLPVGGPFNISSYCLLLCMISHCVGMEPGVFTWSIGDCHIYKNQIDGVMVQLSHDSYPLPHLWLNPDKRDLFSFEYDDIRFDNYQSHPTIKFSVAV